VVLAGLPVGNDDFVARHLIGLDVGEGAVAVASPLAAGQELFFGVRDPPARATICSAYSRGRARHGATAPLPARST
jgi:small ligand-binding sensory domain FIST